MCLVGVFPLQLVVAEGTVDGIVGGVELPHVLGVGDVVLEGGHADMTIPASRGRDRNNLGLYIVFSDIMHLKIY